MGFRMKKPLLIGALTLAIATSMVAGTLAVYNTSVDLADGTVSAKTFYVNATSIDSEAIAINLAPTESSTWAFNLNNASGGVASEVAIDATIEVTVPSEFTAVGVEVALLNGDDSSSGYLVSTADDGTTTTYTFTKSSWAEEGVVTDSDYKLQFTWNDSTVDDSADTAFAGTQDGSVTVKVTGTQHTGA